MTSDAVGHRLSLLERTKERLTEVTQEKERLEKVLGDFEERSAFERLGTVGPDENVPFELANARRRVLELQRSQRNKPVDELQKEQLALEGERRRLQAEGRAWRASQLTQRQGLGGLLLDVAVGALELLPVPARQAAAARRALGVSELEAERAKRVAKDPRHVRVAERLHELEVNIARLRDLQGTIDRLELAGRLKQDAGFRERYGRFQKVSDQWAVLHRLMTDLDRNVTWLRTTPARTATQLAAHDTLLADTAEALTAAAEIHNEPAREPSSS